jgi:hypothetical protein
MPSIGVPVAQPGAQQVEERAPSAAAQIAPVAARAVSALQSPAASAAAAQEAVTPAGHVSASGEASMPAAQASTAANPPQQEEAQAQQSLEGVLTYDAATADPMLPCRILLHLVEGTAGCCSCFGVLLASSHWNPDTWGRWFFVLCMLTVALMKALVSVHMAYRFSSMGRQDLERRCASMKVMWRRSVGLFPALSVTLGGCYLLSACFSIIEASSGNIGMQGGSGAGLLLFLYLSLFLYSALLFLESYTAPKRVQALSETSAVDGKVALPPAPPSGRIRTGRYGKLMPKAATNDTASAFSTCAICLDHFHVMDEAARLPCGHIFHSDCLREWLRVRLQCPFRCAVSLGNVGGQLAASQQAREQTRTRRFQHEREDVPERSYSSAREFNLRVNASVRNAASRGSFDSDV